MNQRKKLSHSSTLDSYFSPVASNIQTKTESSVDPDITTPVPEQCARSTPSNCIGKSCVPIELKGSYFAAFRSWVPRLEKCITCTCMAAMKLAGGHTQSVLCVDSKAEGSTIASGGENGEICIWSRQGQLQHKIQNYEADCTSVVLPRTRENTLYASLGKHVQVLDLRNLQSAVEVFQCNEDEVNQIVLDEKEGYLAACDDSGEIKIISLDEKKVFKTLRRKHTNICSTACFRVRKPWEIFTGGLDCNLIHWDFSRLKCVNQFNMQELQDHPTDAGAYMVNPPFVHHLSTSADGKYLACALGNGFISVFDTHRKNISELVSLQAHSHGASQVHFITNTKLVSGGNDCTIALWDLSKISEPQAQPPSPQPLTNGHAHASTSPMHNRNSEITEKCRVGEIEHNSKVNWLKPFLDGDNHFVIVADQTSELTVLPLGL